MYTQNLLRTSRSFLNYVRYSPRVGLLASSPASRRRHRTGSRAIRIVPCQFLGNGSLGPGRRHGGSSNCNGNWTLGNVAADPKLGASNRSPPGRRGSTGSSGSVSNQFGMGRSTTNQRHPFYCLAAHGSPRIDQSIVSTILWPHPSGATRGADAPNRWGVRRVHHH